MLIDHYKLDRLRVAHATLHERYTAVANRALEGGREAGRIRGEVSASTQVEGEGARIAGMSADELAALSDEILGRAGVPARLVRRLIDVERRTSAARLEAESIAERHRRSCALLDRIEAFAQQFLKDQA